MKIFLLPKMDQKPNFCQKHENLITKSSNNSPFPVHFQYPFVATRYTPYHERNQTVSSQAPILIDPTIFYCWLELLLLLLLCHPLTSSTSHWYGTIIDFTHSSFRWIVSSETTFWKTTKWHFFAQPSPKSQHYRTVPLLFPNSKYILVLYNTSTIITWYNPLLYWVNEPNVFNPLIPVLLTPIHPPPPHP